jgi:hypothetical protein
MVIAHQLHSKTIWGRPHSNVPALRLGSIELCDLLSRELDKANVVLDEWDLARDARQTERHVVPKAALMNALAKAGIELGENGSIYPRPKGKPPR